MSYNRPIEAPVTGPGSMHGTTTTHPAFAVIGANRVSGGAVLFGSDFRHAGYVSITIKRADLNRTNSRDWPYAREELISVDMSEAQWATFVSRMNIGDGVQCTLDRVVGAAMPALPEPTNQSAQFSAESARTAARVAAELKGMRDDIAASGLSAKKAQVLYDRIHQAEMAAGVNQEFVADSFSEHVEKTIQHAAIEINAMVTQAVQQVGLDTIAARGITAPGYPVIEESK